MSSSTALLPKDHKKDEHRIFLRICHSPWRNIHQGILIILRLVTTLYLAINFGLILYCDLTQFQEGWSSVFQFPNIAYFLQLLYQWIALVWTFMHLHYPQHTSSSTSHCAKLLSLPRQNSRTNNRLFFSLFYTAATTFPHVATFIFWAVVVPGFRDSNPLHEIFGQNWLTTLFFSNIYGLNSVLAILEVFVFSSIKRATPIVAHVAGMSLLALVYVAWAGFSYIFTDKYPYYFFDHREVGWQYVLGAVVVFVVIVNIFFGLVYGLTTLREKLTKKAEGSGYTRLPQ